MVVHLVRAIQLDNIGEPARAIDPNALDPGLRGRTAGVRWLTGGHLNWSQILKIELLLVGQYGAIALLLLLVFKNIHSLAGAT